jgi:hypothetical protein
LTELHCKKKLNDWGYISYKIGGFGCVTVPCHSSDGISRYIEISRNKADLYVSHIDKFLKSKGYNSFEELVVLLDEFDAGKKNVIK